MNYYLVVSFSFSILIAGVIGFLRFHKIQKSYYPFLLFVWLGCLNETLSFLIVQSGMESIVNNNIYVLSEALVILYFFNRNRFLSKTYTLVLGFLIAGGWFFETFFIRSITEMSIYFRIGYSFIIVLISIAAINRLLLFGEKNLLKNSMFLICVAFICYFTYKVLVNTFWLYGLGKSLQFLAFISYILIFVNLFTNLIYAFAAIWIPRKPPSLLQS